MLKVFQACFFAEYFHVELVWLFVRVPICMNQFFADLYLRKKGTKERSKKDYRTKKVVRKGISITKKGISLGNRQNTKDTWKLEPETLKDTNVLLEAKFYFK